MKLRKLNNVTGNKITLDPWLLNFQLASDWLTDSLIWKAVVASVSLLEQNFGTKLKFFFPGRRAEKKKHVWRKYINLWAMPSGKLQNCFEKEGCLSKLQARAIRK